MHNLILFMAMLALAQAQPGLDNTHRALAAGGKRAHAVELVTSTCVKDILAFTPSNYTPWHRFEYALILEFTPAFYNDSSWYPYYPYTTTPEMSAITGCGPDNSLCSWYAPHQCLINHVSTPTSHSKMSTITYTDSALRSGGGTYDGGYQALFMQGEGPEGRGLDFSCKFDVRYVQYQPENEQGKPANELPPCTCDLRIVMSASGNTWVPDCPCLGPFAAQPGSANSISMKDAIMHVHHPEP